MPLQDAPIERQGGIDSTQAEDLSDDSDLVVNTADVARKLAPSRGVPNNTSSLPSPPRPPGRPVPPANPSTVRPVLLSTPSGNVAAKSASTRPPPPSRPPRHRSAGGQLRVVRPNEMPSETVMEMEVELDPNGDDIERNLPQFAEFLKSRQATESSLPLKPSSAPRLFPSGDPPTTLKGNFEEDQESPGRRAYERGRGTVYGKLPRKPPVQYAVPSMGREIAPPSSRPRSTLPRNGYNAYPGYYEQVVKMRNEEQANGTEGGGEDSEAPQMSSRRVLDSAPVVESPLPRVVEPMSSPQVVEYEYVPYDKKAMLSEFNSAGLEREGGRSWTVQPADQWTAMPWGNSSSAAEEYLEGRGGISWEREAGEVLEDLPGGSSRRRCESDDFASEGGEGSSSESSSRSACGSARRSFGERYSAAHREEFGRRRGRDDRSEGRSSGGGRRRRGSSYDSRRRSSWSSEENRRGDGGGGFRRRGSERSDGSGVDSRSSDDGDDDDDDRNSEYSDGSGRTCSYDSGSSWYAREGGSCSSSSSSSSSSSRTGSSVRSRNDWNRAGKDNSRGSREYWNSPGSEWNRYAEKSLPSQCSPGGRQEGGKGGQRGRPQWADEIRFGQPNGVLPSYNQNTVKPSEILGNLGKTKPSSPQAPTSPVSLEDLPTATPGKAAATVDPRGDALGGIKKEWVSGVFKWIAKLDGLWYMRGNATTVIKYRFKPVDALADDRGRFMAVQIEDSPANVGYLILKEPESRHMNNYFYTDLVSLEDLRPAVKEKGVLWQLTEGCFNSNFDTLTFIRPSDDPKSGGTQWLVFDRQPRKKSDTPDSRESRRSSQQQQQHVVTPEAPHSGRHEDGGGDRYGDWTHWKKSDSAWQWDDYNKSYEGEGKWRNHQKGWGQEWKKGETRFKGVVDWNRVEYHPDWRRFTGEWYGFKQYGEAPRPSFKSYELPGPHKDDHLIDMATILFVYGFPRSYSEDDLKEAFSKFGEVQEAKVKRKWGHRGYGAGYGWIRYANRDECERCIAATKNKMTFQGMNYPAKVRPAMDKDFHLEYRDKLYPEDMARRTGYWLKVLKNIECIPKNYDKGFELRVFGRVVLQFDIGARKATLYDAAVSKHVAIFVMNLFLENVVDCRIDNYHAVGESDENYQVYKNFSRRGATDSEPYESGMELDLRPCKNADLDSASRLTEVLKTYILIKQHKIENRDDGWLV